MTTIMYVSAILAVVIILTIIGVLSKPKVRKSR